MMPSSGTDRPTRLVSMTESCDRLGITERTCRRWIAQGLLTGYRVGPRLIRLDADEVESLIQPIPTAATA